MNWIVIRPVEKGRTHMTTHQAAVGPLHLSVMERHPWYGLCYAFYPFIDTTKAQSGDLDGAKREAIQAARTALSDTLNALMPEGEIFI